MPTRESTPDTQIDCCPVMEKMPVCDTLNFRYRLPFNPRVNNDNRQTVPVEVVLHFRLERCSGPLVLGDPSYSTTLLPGEKVRMFTSDRHSRWSYDSESNLSYRHETTSEESFFTAGMAKAMSDLTINESGAAVSSYEESWAEGGGGASVNILGIIKIGGGGGGGSYDASSASAFSHSLSQHAESASAYVAASVRAKSSTSVGEVESRTHTEGESEAQYESASRMFSNPNKCSAVTYLFHKINKVQRVRFRLIAIERRVDDTAAPTGAYQRVPVDTSGKISVIPKAIPSTNKERLEVEEIGRVSALQQYQATASLHGIGSSARLATSFATVNPSVTFTPVPIDPKLREKAIAAVDADLVKAGMLDEKTKKPTEKIIAELSWEREDTIPTPGIMVKGCLDDCITCEPALRRKIELDLERKALENALLKQKIELLDQSQEYRCCPTETSDMNAEHME